MADAQPMHVDVGLVRELAELLDQTNLTEVEVADGERRIRVVRAPAPVMAAPAHAATAPAPASMPVAPGHAPLAASAAAATDDFAGAVRSPIVGTAYLTPEPTAPAFVSEGDTVTEGQTLLIIEAMKVMNPIPAPRAGRVTRILIDHGQPVEFDQPLIVLA